MCEVYITLHSLDWHVRNVTEKSAFNVRRGAISKIFRTRQSQVHSQRDILHKHPTLIHTLTQSH